ncbi:hypothetical protein Ancab_021493 [Ancistrocladus abbreviatus]
MVVTSLKAVADFSNFKLEKNKLAMPTPIGNRPTDGIELVKGLSLKAGGGSSEKNSLLFLSGLERLNGGLLSTAQVRIYNRVERSAGPRIRLEFMKTIEDIQREAISVYSSSPGLT